MQNKAILKVIGILWIIWGLVHAFAGIMTIVGETSDAIAAIADAVDPVLLTGPYHEAVGAVVNQHGFNLLWIGLTTTVCASFIWRGNLTAIFIAGLTGGLADIGYFLFLDLGGFVHFVPGTVMTLISSLAILLSIWVWRQSQARS
jgi:hypothetical protein